MDDNLLAILRAHGVTVKLREIREAHNLTLEELATLCGITKSRLAEKETGKAHIRLIDLQRIANALEVPLWTLIDVELNSETQSTGVVSSVPGSS
jgi:transcriptional regulator with XRE-family HTH domain